MSETHQTAVAVDDKRRKASDKEAAVTGADKSQIADNNGTDKDSAVSAGHSSNKHPAEHHKQAKKAGGRKDDASISASPSALRDRLLASISLPSVRIDPKSLPRDLCDALDDAHLTDAQNLPVATFAALAAVTAVASGTMCDRPVPGLSPSGGLSLRLAVVSAEPLSTVVPPSLLAALYATEGDARDLHAEAAQEIDRARRQNEHLQRLYEQVERAGGRMSDIPSLNGLSSKSAPPRIVLANTSEAAIRSAAAGGTGLFLTHDRHAPWLTQVNDNFDSATARLLNAIAAGYMIPVADEANRRVNMGAVTVGVVGALDVDACNTLYKCDKAQLRATILVPAAIPPTNGSPTKLAALLRRARQVGLQKLTLQLHADLLASAAQQWATASAGLQPPLAAFFDNAPDLARRLAVALHLSGTDAADGVIQAQTVACAVDLVNEAVLPAARSLAGPCSVVRVENDARRIIDWVRTHTSLVDRIFERRVLLRAWQRSMTAPRLDAALALLGEAELLLNSDGLGRTFEVAATVFEPI